MTTEAIEAVRTPPDRARQPGTAASWLAAGVTLDRSTLIDAYGEHRGAACRLAYQILGDGAAAEDAVQDAFLKLWTGTAQFDPSRGSMRGLLMTIARHTSIDVTRRRARRQKIESAYCSDATYVTDGPEQATELADDARSLRAALGELPGDQRRTIEMAYFSGLTCRQIAATMTIPVGTVKSRMRLGMRKLSVTLGDDAVRGDSYAEAEVGR